MFLTLLFGLIVAVPLVVSFGEHARQQGRRMSRRIGLATVGTCSLSLGVVFGSLFFASVVGAQEAPAKKELPASKDSDIAALEKIKIAPSAAARKAAAKLPAWVDSEPSREGDHHSLPVASKFFETEAEAIRNLDEKIRSETGKYIDWWVGRDGASRHVRLPVKEIKRRWLKTKEPIVEHREFSFGDMYRSHALLEFTPDFRKRVTHHWEEFVARSRLWQVGLGGAGILLVLLTFFGYFRVDNATRGYYTGRLQFLAAIAILALIGAGLYFARLIPWV